MSPVCAETSSTCGLMADTRCARRSPTLTLPWRWPILRSSRETTAERVTEFERHDGARRITPPALPNCRHRCPRSAGSRRPPGCPTPSSSAARRGRTVPGMAPASRPINGAARLLCSRHGLISLISGNRFLKSRMLPVNNGIPSVTASAPMKKSESTLNFSPPRRLYSKNVRPALNRHSFDRWIRSIDNLSMAASVSSILSIP
jgi:hypothetical protein